MPVLFIGHGNPMNAIEDNGFRRSWQRLGEELPRPRAILCVSAHWETYDPAVTAAERPETIHDFLGFPQALFDLEYPAPGDPSLAGRVAELLADDGAVPDTGRGFDHGAWSVLAPMYPGADIPLVQLSLAAGRGGDWHLQAAARLGPLRDEGVLVVASGNIVHNLGLFDWNDTAPMDWAVDFDAAVRARITAGDRAALAEVDRLGPDAARAVPTPEHYLPLLYALGLRTAADRIRFFNTELLSTISMSSFVLK